MRDIWEITGRFVAAGSAPAAVKELERHAIRNGSVIVVMQAGIQPAQNTLRAQFPETVVSLFAAGEVVRFMGIGREGGVNFFRGQAGAPASASPAYFECLGLALADGAFRSSARAGNFEHYDGLLTVEEKTALVAYLNKPADDDQGQFISDITGEEFRRAGWGGGSCRIAMMIYAEYVHTP